MTRPFFLAIAVLVSSSVFAEPIIYICERPAWEGVEGCGPNNTYYTYGFIADTDNFDHLENKDSFRYERPEYVIAKRKGCSLEGARGAKATFTVKEEVITFWFSEVSTSHRPYTQVDLDPITMTAEIQGVKRSPLLTCEEVKGDAISAHPKLRGSAEWGHLLQQMTVPASVQNPRPYIPPGG